MVHYTRIISSVNIMSYNRRTPADQKANLSLESQIEGVFKYGSLEEIITQIKQHFVVSKKTFSQRTNLISPSLPKEKS
jgi:predicted site-specific integrase-resolvase